MSKKKYPIVKTKAEVDRLITSCERAMYQFGTTHPEFPKIEIQIAELKAKRKKMLF